MSDYANPDGTEAVGFDQQSQPHLSIGLPDISNDLNQSLFAELYDAVRHRDPRVLVEAMQKALLDGYEREQLSDFYIPEIARVLGNDWCTDQCSFAEVTIGVGRLRNALRRLGPEWTSDMRSAPNAATALVLVADGAQHTLGASLIAGQLRRTGISTRLCIGQTPTDVQNLLYCADFDAVLISAALGESLESLRLIVETVREFGETAPPIVLGGTIVADTRPIKKLTGVDLLTADLEEAISFCKLRIKRHHHQSVKD